MAWSFSDDKLIFQQLVDIIKRDIISGRYRPGDRLPPVRELAVTAGVNPNTVQRALAAVEETGLIHTRRGDGRYIGEDAAVIDAVRRDYVSECVGRFIGEMRALGLDDSAIIGFVTEGFSAEKGGNTEKGGNDQ